MSELSPEQREKIAQVWVGMSARFELPMEDFRVYDSRTTEGIACLAVMYTGYAGAHCGSWHDLMDDRALHRKRYEFNVDGHVLDARKGMTLSNYRRIMESAGKDLDHLPDYEGIAVQNGELRTWTLLSGEASSAAGVFVPRVAVDESGTLQASWIKHSDNYPFLRFRPAIEIT